MATLSLPDQVHRWGVLSDWPTAPSAGRQVLATVIHALVTYALDCSVFNVLYVRHFLDTVQKVEIMQNCQTSVWNKNTAS